MILGPGAPSHSLRNWRRYLSPLLPGGGRARVQPIHVDDVVSCLLAAVRPMRSATRRSTSPALRRCRWKTCCDASDRRAAARGTAAARPAGASAVAAAPGRGDRTGPTCRSRRDSCPHSATTEWLRKSLQAGAELAGVDQMLLRGTACGMAGPSRCRMRRVHPSPAGLRRPEYVMCRTRRRTPVPALSPAGRFDSCWCGSRDWATRARQWPTLMRRSSAGFAAPQAAGRPAGDSETCPPFSDLIDDHWRRAPVAPGAIGLVGLGARGAGRRIDFPAHPAVLALSRRGRDDAALTVIGSGASGVHFALSVLRNGGTVRMFDVGRQGRAAVLPEQLWTISSGISGSRGVLPGRTVREPCCCRASPTSTTGSRRARTTSSTAPGDSATSVPVSRRSFPSRRAGWRSVDRRVLSVNAEELRLPVSATGSGAAL